MALNPTPARIGAALWEFWEAFHEFEPTVVLGGIYANKGGYHNARANLSGRDYSVGEVAADRKGRASLSAAIDLTMSDAAMRRYTTRLDVAARARDPRLYPPGRPPVLREFIGTKDNRRVYCYVLTGGLSRGLTADAGPDYSRDDTHLWHLHLSIIRIHADDGAALAGVLSVLKGEPSPDGDGEDDVKLTDKIALVIDKGVKYSSKTATVAGILASTHYYLLALRALVTGGIRDIIAAIKAQRLSDEDVARVAEAVAARMGGTGSGPARKS